MTAALVISLILNVALLAFFVAAVYDWADKARELTDMKRRAATTPPPSHVRVVRKDDW